MTNNTRDENTARARRLRAGATVAAMALAISGSLAGTAVAATKYRVQPGDSLAEIASEHGFTAADGWRHVYSVNPKIDNPDVIEPGQVLRIPSSKTAKQRKLPDGYGEPRRAATTSRGASAAQSSTPAAPTSGVWQQLAACESGGNWSANTGNGYYGGLQFSLSSWRAVGGTGYPHEASAGTQIAMAERLRASQGWGAWPSCAAQLGLR